MTKNLVVEITRGSTGKTMLKLNNFKFCYDKKNQEGLHVWRCIQSLCTAKFYTDDGLTVVQHSKNSFQHNHVQSRTKLVKRLVIKEIEKVVALNGGQPIPITDLKKYALNYLNQAFASTLKPNEMNSVKKAVQRYCVYYRGPMDISSGLVLTESSQNKGKPSVQNPNELRRLKICKAVEQQVMQQNHEHDQFSITSSSESESEGTENNDVKEQLPVNDSECEEIPENNAALVFRPGGNQPQFDHLDASPCPNVTVVQSTGPVYSMPGEMPKADFPESVYTVSRSPGWPPAVPTTKEGEVIELDDESQTSIQTAFDPLTPEFVYQSVPQSLVDMRFASPGSAFSFVGAAVPTMLIPRMQPIESVIDLSGNDMNQRTLVVRDQLNMDDEDYKFCMSLAPMFRMLSPSDKSMIKAQIHQLITWKLKMSQ